MPVIVNPPASITVRVGTATQPRIQSTSTFTGSSSSQQQIDQALALANSASATANSALVNVNAAYNEANSAYVLANTAIQTTGGEVTGNLIVDGTLTAKLDGGLF
jgi:hypothetical protein